MGSSSRLVAPAYASVNARAYSCAENMNAFVSCIKGLPCPFTLMSHASCAEWCSSMASCRAFVSNRYQHCYLRPFRGDLVASEATHETKVCWLSADPHMAGLRHAYVISLAVRPHGKQGEANDKVCLQPRQWYMSLTRDCLRIHMLSLCAETAEHLFRSLEPGMWTSPAALPYLPSRTASDTRPRCDTSFFKVFRARASKSTQQCLFPGG